MKRLLIHLALTVAVIAIAMQFDAGPPARAGDLAEVITAGAPLSAHAPAALAAMEACESCHDDEVASFNRTTHAHSWQGGVTCENCHGDATKHLEADGGKETIVSYASLTTEQITETCLKCHERVGEQAHSRLSEHGAAGVACTSCHTVHPSAEELRIHNAKGKSAMLPASQSQLCLSCHNEVKSDFNKPTHHRLVEGVLECTNCHNPHGSGLDHQVKAEPRDLCVSCHADKKGPFSFQHDAASIDGCMGCHESHGSSGKHLLKFRDSRQLCLSCHSRETGKGVPHGRASMTTMGDCTKCHTEIHGSNKNPFFTE